MKKNRFLYNLTIVTAGIVLVFLFLGSPTEAAEKKAAPIHYKYSTFAPPSHLTYPAVERIIKRLNEVSGGEVTVDYYGAEALGKAKEHYDLINEGLADMGAICQSYTPARFPVSTMTTLPFFSESAITATLVLEELFNKGVTSNEYKDIHVLDFFSTPPNQMFSRKKIEKIQDFRGMRIIGNSPAFMQMWKALGASSVPMGYPDIYLALQRGTLDAAPTSWAASESWKWAEVADYPTQINLSGGFACATIMNKKSWNKLSPKTQKAWTKVYNEEEYHSVPKAYNASENKGKQYWLNAGKKITVFPADERKNLAAKMLPVWQYFIDDVEKKGYPGKKAYLTYVEVMKKQGEPVVIQIPGLYKE